MPVPQILKGFCTNTRSIHLKILISPYDRGIFQVSPLTCHVVGYLICPGQSQLKELGQGNCLQNDHSMINTLLPLWDVAHQIFYSSSTCLYQGYIRPLTYLSTEVYKDNFSCNINCLWNLSTIQVIFTRAVL